MRRADVLELDIPGLGQRRWRHLLLDMNGTVALDGLLLPGVAERLEALRPSLSITLLTADTHGTGRALAEALGIGYERIARGGESAAKARAVEERGGEDVIAVGNGRNDAAMLRAASLGIAVLGPEGTAAEAIQAADVVARDILEALDLLRHPLRLLATLRA